MPRGQTVVIVCFAVLLGVAVTASQAAQNQIRDVAGGLARIAAPLLQQTVDAGHDVAHGRFNDQVAAFGREQIAHFNELIASARGVVAENTRYVQEQTGRIGQQIGTDSDRKQTLALALQSFSGLLVPHEAAQPAVRTGRSAHAPKSDHPVRDAAQSFSAQSEALSEQVSRLLKKIRS